MLARARSVADRQVMDASDLIVPGADDDPRDALVLTRRCLAAAEAADRVCHLAPGHTWSFAPVSAVFDPVLDFWLSGHDLDVDALLAIDGSDPADSAAGRRTALLVFARTSPDPLAPTVDPMSDLVPVPAPPVPDQRLTLLIAATAVLREIGASTFEREAAADAILLEAARLAA